MAAEAIAITASIFSVIEFGGKVLVAGYGFLSKVKKAPIEISRLLAEVAGLRALLDQLRIFAAEGDDQNAETALRILQDHGVLNDCTTLLSAVQNSIQKCQATEGGHVAGLAKGFQWPFKEKETKDLTQQLSRLRDTLTAAVSVDSAYVIGKFFEVPYPTDKE